jgi:large subunit ribosomal protein L25
MLNLSVKIRKDLGKKVKALRKRGILPGVLYGPKLKESQPLELDQKDFEKVYKEAGESSLISLEVDDKKILVLIHEVKLDPLTEKPIHVDFYQPRLEEEVTAVVPLIFEGETAAVKDLGGTLVKNISEVEVKAKPQNLPHEIKVNIEKLKTFEDDILIKDLLIPKDVKILKAPEEIVASVSPPEKVEEELEKPIEEKPEEVEKVKEEEKAKEEKAKEEKAKEEEAEEKAK